MQRIQPLEIFTKRNTFLIDEIASWVKMNSCLETETQLNFDKYYSKVNNGYTTHYNKSEFAEINYKPIYFLKDEVFFMKLFNSLKYRIKDICNYNEFAKVQLNLFTEIDSKGENYNKWIFEIEDFFKEDLKDFCAVAQEIKTTDKYRVFKNDNKELFINTEDLKQISSLFDLYNKYKGDIIIKEYTPKFTTSEIKEAIIESCLKKEVSLALPYIICNSIETKFPSKYRIYSFLNSIVSSAKERVVANWGYYKSNWKDEGKDWVCYNFIEENGGENLCIPPLLFREEKGKLYFDMPPF